MLGTCGVTWRGDPATAQVAGRGKGNAATIRELRVVYSDTTMRLFKKFDASAEAVQLGRKHGVDQVIDMPSRIRLDPPFLSISSHK